MLLGGVNDALETLASREAGRALPRLIVFLDPGAMAPTGATHDWILLILGGGHERAGTEIIKFQLCKGRKMKGDTTNYLQ